MSRIMLLLGSFALMALGSFMATTQGSEAHERRTVGAYNFVFFTSPTTS